MKDGRRPHRSLPRAFIVLGCILAVAWALVAVFEVGVLMGLALAGGGLVVWAVPATVLGWPGPTINDLVGFVVDLALGVIEGLAAFLRSLFDWP